MYCKKLLYLKTFLFGKYSLLPLDRKPSAIFMSCMDIHVFSTTIDVIFKKSLYNVIQCYKIFLFLLSTVLNILK